MIDGAHPLVVQIDCRRHADEADAGALRVSGADKELLAARILDVL